MLTPAFCTLTLATAKALQGTLQAAPTEALQNIDCTVLTTEALLLLLSLSACIDPVMSSTEHSAKASHNTAGHSQQLPPGMSMAAAQQLQGSIDAVCSGGSMLLQGCASELCAHLGSSLLLAILPVMQALPAGRPSHQSTQQYK